MHCCWPALVAMLMGVSLVAGPACAQEMFAGTWQVTDAQPAPWVDGSSSTQPDVNEAMRAGRITFAKDRVDGPPPLGCDRARYETNDVGPDYLFQGGLADPARQAAALGFTSDRIVALSMSCIRDDADIGMDFALVDDNTAMFALDNVIYTMVRTAVQ